MSDWRQLAIDAYRNKERSEAEEARIKREEAYNRKLATIHDALKKLGIYEFEPNNVQHKLPYTYYFIHAYATAAGQVVEVSTYKREIECAYPVDDRLCFQFEFNPYSGELVEVSTRVYCPECGFMQPNGYNLTDLATLGEALSNTFPCNNCRSKLNGLGKLLTASPYAELAGYKKEHPIPVTVKPWKPQVRRVK